MMNKKGNAMRKEKKLGKAPAFQLYPDKALAGSDHLQGDSFKAYWKVIWWMWLHSDDQCSMPDTEVAWKMATGINGVKLKSARADIMVKEMPLFKKKGGKLISSGLKKEAEKQNAFRKQKQDAAKSRWSKQKQPVRPQSARNAPASTEQDDGDEPAPSMEGVPQEFLDNHPAYCVLVDDPQFRNVTPEMYVQILQAHPQADEKKAVKKAVDTALLMTTGLDNPALFLRKQFSRIEEEGGSGDGRRSSLPKKKKKKTDTHTTQKKERTPF